MGKFGEQRHLAKWLSLLNKCATAYAWKTGKYGKNRPENKRMAIRVKKNHSAFAALSSVSFCFQLRISLPVFLCSSFISLIPLVSFLSFISFLSVAGGIVVTCVCAFGDGLAPQHFCISWTATYWLFQIDGLAFRNRCSHDVVRRMQTCVRTSATCCRTPVCPSARQNFRVGNGKMVEETVKDLQNPAPSILLEKHPI